MNRTCSACLSLPPYDRCRYKRDAHSSVTSTTTNMSALPKVFLTPEDAHKMIQTAFTSESSSPTGLDNCDADEQCGIEHTSHTRTSSKLAVMKLPMKLC